MAVNADGKYTKKTKEVVKTIEEAFAMDCSIKEVLIHANISKQTLYNWMEEDKEWKERLDELKATPFLKARKTIIKGISENYQNAMDYLKRKKKLEFGDSMSIDNTISINGKDKEKANEAINEFLNDKENTTGE